MHWQVIPIRLFSFITSHLFILQIMRMEHRQKKIT